MLRMSTRFESFPRNFKLRSILPNEDPCNVCKKRYTGWCLCRKTQFVCWLFVIFFNFLVVLVPSEAFPWLLEKNGANLFREKFQDFRNYDVYSLTSFEILTGHLSVQQFFWCLFKSLLSGSFLFPSVLALYVAETWNAVSRLVSVLDDDGYRPRSVIA